MFEHEALEACIAEAGDSRAESLRDRILAKISAHAGEGLQLDDLTLVVARAH
jgi:serine phosphatase RsbU (regulator of sigma subunit)